MDLKVVKYSVDDEIATITLNRPHRMNAWTGRMHTEYRWVLANADEDSNVRVIVVTGEGRGFCVGADSKALEGHVEKGGYDPGTPDPLAEPGFGTSPEFDASFAYQGARGVDLLRIQGLADWVLQGFVPDLTLFFDLPLEQGLGRILAAPLRSHMDLPPFNKSAMDGYAIAAGDQRDTYRVVASLAAGCSTTPSSNGAADPPSVAAPTSPSTTARMENTDRTRPRNSPTAVENKSNPRNT